MIPETEGTFAEAIAKLRATYCVRRRGWAAGNYISPTLFLDGVVYRAVGLAHFFSPASEPRVLITATWLPTLIDLLATDWIIVTDPSYNSETPVLDPP